MDVDDWLLFTRIVDLGSLSETSRRLGLPKSTLSRRLAKLENDFGARLIHRSGQSFTLTEAGRALYGEASRLADQAQGAAERLNERIGREGGTIRIAAPKTPGGLFLGDWLAAFLREHPDIRIELDLADRVVNLQEGGYDLALRVGPLADSSLIAKPLGRTERWLVASPDCIARHGRPASPAQLAAIPCIGFGEQHSGYGTWPLTQGKRSVAFRYRPVLRCDDMAAIFRACLGGAGVAMIPAFVCRDAVSSGALERILPEWRGPPAPFHLVFCPFPTPRCAPQRVSQQAVNTRTTTAPRARAALPE